MTETINVANIDKVHKNPIAELVQTACQFESHIDISSEGKNINAKSLMGIMAFGLKEGIEVTISAEGSDESQAIESLKKFLTLTELSEKTEIDKDFGLSCVTRIYSKKVDECRELGVSHFIHFLCYFGVKIFD